MKRFLSLLLAALMLVTCASALAEATRYQELGLAFDFSVVQDRSANCPSLNNYGIVSTDPFIASMGVLFTNLPKSVMDSIDSMAEDSEDAAAYSELIDTLTVSIGQIVVTNAGTLVEAGADEAVLAQCEVTEFGAQGDYHYFFITNPPDRLTAFYDAAEDAGDYENSPQQMKADMLADVALVKSELLDQLRSAELFTPVNPAEAFIGKVIEFESVDLDGSVVRSADLFRDNRITMVNIWGTWCVNCMNELGALAELHKRLQEKGCGIVGVEYEREALEDVADTARKALMDNGVTYPNVLIPEDNPVFEMVHNYPFTLFVDSEGRIVTYPIRGAAIFDYEPTIDKLLANETPESLFETGSTPNEAGEYRVFVYDTQGDPVKGAIVQLCDESTCAFQKTNADGMAIFQVEAPKVFDVHVAKAPKGYQSSDETCRTLDTFSDVNLFISKAE